MSDFARCQHPGYHGGWTPTTDWKAPKAPWFWVVYSKPDEEGMCTRYCGYTESEDEAETVVREWHP